MEIRKSTQLAAWKYIHDLTTRSYIKVEVHAK